MPESDILSWPAILMIQKTGSLVKSSETAFRDAEAGDELAGSVALRGVKWKVNCRDLEPQRREINPLN